MESSRSSSNRGSDSRLSSSQYIRSVEGWIIFVTNIHEESQEDDFRDLLKEYGNLKDLQLNLDRRTGYFKGYAVAQYPTEKEAAAAIEGLTGRNFLGQELKAGWCFVKGEVSRKR